MSAAGKASPGEWRPGFNARDFDHAVYTGNQQIAAVWAVGEVHEQNKEAATNARIMAAGKRMAELLHDVIRDGRASPELLKRAEAVLREVGDE